ncbi:nickel responsive regulator [Thalassospira lucentensis]|jgi:CopG family nickel-responsive transcriptional regulator|uniref:Putative nickel-responsive regulator n=3 Tax=Thalassospira TaxID=168934 RepID=A0A285RSP3_9PROT|nr:MULTISPECIES: nickel-responsive transcriptional regulator NikR [Thalassospira]UKV15466.1 nickel-responsive transcriptional regulator NikR [Thalassospiraceae bacterium SW-3-3]KZB62279.1 nickel responsive regulator [Thalassospira lucentensis]MAZ34318.1 nickel-responsive transcriptional regulator NikR [Thalassospira sp.]MCH2275047.1 nickel-responsive transcriptional regulator NikR [Thalassospira sp.]RCK06064.1 nickel responsive regulator [Thalassospira xianhensis MCCC 1A02616]|tara:strand:+ start:404 stop:883 length:480 start_codon:yes stop_codon:yes gene_type:complete
MTRVTVSIEDDLMEAFDAFLEHRGYTNRSEGFRDLIREKLQNTKLDEDTGGVGIAVLNYVYDHEERMLASRLMSAQHEHHDLTVSTVHFHIDHDTCLESVTLRGKLADIRRFADQVLAQPGVRHGQLYSVPGELHVEAHHHGDDDHGHAHRHEHLKITT